MSSRMLWAAALAAFAVALAAPALHSAPQVEANPAEVIAYFGHGKVLDAAMKPIKLDDATLQRLQEAMLAEVLKSPGKSDPDTQVAIREARELLASGKLAAGEAMLVRAGITHAALIGADARLRQRLDWRNDALFLHTWNRDLKFRELLPQYLLELLKRLHLFEPVERSTDYMADCKAHNVPVPPDWDESGRQWKFQGRLGLNILAGSEYAGVWTYSDPVTRGACIALPRGSGAAGSLAGIICQSATTGHACFWDNQLKSAPANVLGWSGRTLVIADLVDGSDMAEAKRCTDCHRGNNVFILSPDDATWGRVLRGPLLGGSTGTFTTRVEASADTTGGHPRYIPITTLPPRPAWNNPATANCGAACHEIPAVTRPSTMPMPPACASGSPPGNPAANCYGNP